MTELLATAEPGNAQYQGVSHDRLGDLAVTAEDTSSAEQNDRTALDICRAVGRRPARHRRIRAGRDPVVSAARPPDSEPADGSTSRRGFRKATPMLGPPPRAKRRVEDRHARFQAQLDLS
jgi:hypothetical protein